MKLLVYECPEDRLEGAIRWLTSGLGLRIFKTQEIIDESHNTSYIQVIVVVLDKETESLLKIKYPGGTFKDFTA